MKKRLAIERPGARKRLSLDKPSQFSATALPQTMAFAALFRSGVDKRASGLPRDWPFEDRVLAWLVPELFEDVRAFHDSRGPALVGLFTEYQVGKLDRELAEQLLLTLSFSASQAKVLQSAYRHGNSRRKGTPRTAERAARRKHPTNR